MSKMIYLFGDMCSTPEECHRLAELILVGLNSGLARESRAGYLTENPDGSFGACIQTLALIGHHESIEWARVELEHYGPDKRKRIAKVISISEEVLDRVLRWHLIDRLSAREIVERLLAVNPHEKSYV